MGVAIAIPIAAGITVTDVVVASAAATAVVAGTAVIANAANNRNSESRKRPTFRCHECGGPHGGCYGNLCQFCYFKKNGSYRL